ncbi:hypothetical protein Tco_0041616, partial [Tanacetum coccineum]
MRRQADGFSGRVTPLFDTMMVKLLKIWVLIQTIQLILIKYLLMINHQHPLNPRRKQRQDTEVPSPTSEIPVEENVPTPSIIHYLVRVESSKDKESLGDQEDPSKQGRNIADIDQDENVTLIDESQGNLNDEDMFGVNDLHGEEVIVEDIAAPIIPVTTAEIVTAITTVATSVTTAPITRPKTKGVVIQEPSETITRKTIAQPPTSKDKGKVIIIEPEKPLKKKDQVAADEELARQLEAEMQAEIAVEERLRRQKEEEAIIALIESWENTQAMMEADRLLAKKLQTRER